MTNLTVHDIENILGLINRTDIKGAESDGVTLLKQKLMAEGQRLLDAGRDETQDSYAGSAGGTA